MGSIASQVCKCIPGSPCFPSQEELDLLSSNLSHPLVVGQRPFASVCYNSAAGYDSLACQEATANQFSIEIRAASSNTLQWVNFEDYITTSTVQQCPFNQTNGDLCYQGRVPSYAINVTTVEDIQATIRFASKYNLRLVVKNTGHELMGRPFGIGAIELFMHHMKGTNFTDNFVPIGTAADDTDSQPGPGVQWADLYLAAQEHNRSVAGGFVPHGTVGAGAGWPMGGGHSPLSPFFGLGVDNVLQYTVVLPNASHVVANQYIHPDLFWALRGGGGPSFGVATSLTYRTHPNYPYTGAFYVASAHSSTSFHALLALWVKHHNDVADAGWAGTWPWSNNTLYLTLLAQGLPATQTANTTLEAFFAASRALPGVNVSLALTVPYTSFYEFYFDNLVDGSLGFGMNYTAGEQGGINQATSSWLVPREIYDTNSSTLADALANMPSGSAFMGGWSASELSCVYWGVANLEGRYLGWHNKGAGRGRSKEHERKQECLKEGERVVAERERVANSGI
ncbi:predicted protein [Postia placenta Mad-698-R]|uniref:FAD-binding PCMH-type domain-containing protein n=1 Tax=Postia placenta MAD-698-R-SB12 TaxID=670580 RepID=A0A1X6N7Q9_9APHY|nr:hypothetical protein POSPLADRAFT_1134138 [Postia placenta MAD-698-R-SB12]EED78480.1 predicted protein [Postia placenta Mad-698-R]OSX64668.1 hypothetical protein POSPLADRAFT_1134138 [Postia placenta MAD-698-R-SB12]